MKTTILTTTLYRSVEETRFHLACQMIGNAVAMNYNVVVFDASPSVIREAFQRIGADIHRSKNKGMGPERRELFKFARDLDSEIFVWTEPEKIDLVRLVPKIIESIKNGEADIVIPSRTERSWQSYPNFQISSEQEANAVYAEIIGKNFDPMFGPVAFRGNMVDYFAYCNPTEQFGAADGYIQHFAPIEAMANDYEVISVPVDCFYPSVQKAEEESMLLEEMVKKRKWQFDQLVAGYRLAAKAFGLPQ